MKLAAALLTLLMPLCVFAHEDDPKHKQDKPKTAIAAKKTVAATGAAPEYVQLAKNVEVIPNIETAVKSSGVLTHEGLFGPLLFAEQNRAFFIELKPGMFLGEHPHDLGSIVYTVRGKWVLASEGKRQVMETGSLFRFGDNMPTGWEAPFPEGALLLVVKLKGNTTSYDNFNKGLKSMQVALDKERKDGVPFYFNELKQDHPAVVFARSVNPNFDSLLKSIKY